MVKNLEFDIHHVVRTSSTQDAVRDAALRGAAPGYCVVADEQTAGRGRLGRRWVSPPGTSLLASVLLRPQATLEGIPFVAGLAAIDALRRECRLEAQLKWPNDVLLEGRKLAGVLVEGISRSGAAAPLVIVGLGMNLMVRAFPDDVSAVSLDQLVARAPDRDRVLSAWLGALTTRLSQLADDGLAALLADWRCHAWGLGQPATVTTPAGIYAGVAVDVDDTGALVLRTHSGIQRVVAGDLTVS
jgi:BirA family biotin operon repressor/biotin-[acetyl-CoA-carboxylase] ligase